MLYARAGAWARKCVFVCFALGFALHKRERALPYARVRACAWKCVFVCVCALCDDARRIRVLLR